MTEDDLLVIESLFNQRKHVNAPSDQWSAGMTKAMLDKIPELVAEVRRRMEERKILISTLELNLETLKNTENFLDKVKA